MELIEALGAYGEPALEADGRHASASDDSWISKWRRRR
jgi:hypothetical protein